MIWLGFSWAFLLGFLMSTLKFGKLMWQRIPDLAQALRAWQSQHFLKGRKKKCGKDLG